MVGALVFRYNALFELLLAMKLSKRHVVFLTRRIQQKRLQVSVSINLVYAAVAIIDLTIVEELILEKHRRPSWTLIAVLSRLAVSPISQRRIVDRRWVILTFWSSGGAKLVLEESATCVEEAASTLP